MSAGEGGGRPPPDTLPPFRLRSSLLRTPPPPRQVFDSMMMALLPKQKTSPPPPPPMPRQVSGPSKRYLSPDEPAQKKKPRHRVAKPCASLAKDVVVDTTLQRELFTQSESPGQEFRTPCSTNLEEDAGDDMERASTRRLISLANKAADKINEIDRSPVCQLNKSDSSTVSNELSNIMEIVSQLAVMLEGSQKTTETSKVRSTASTKHCATRRKGQAEEKKWKARYEAAIAATMAGAKSSAALSANTGPPMTFADKVRMSSGLVMTIYPQEEAGIKTAEETEKLLKTFVAPASLNIKVDRLKKIAGAGLLIQTSKF